MFVLTLVCVCDSDSLDGVDVSFVGYLSDNYIVASDIFVIAVS